MSDSSESERPPVIAHVRRTARIEIDDNPRPGQDEDRIELFFPGSGATLTVQTARRLFDALASAITEVTR